MAWHSRVWEIATKYSVRFGYRSTLDFLDYVRSCASSDWDELTTDQQVEVIKTVCDSVLARDGQPS